MIPLRVAAIIRIVCNLAQVSEIDLLGSRRERRLAWPRMIAYWLIREHTSLSWPQIAAVFNRDHTTVLQGARRIAELRETNAEVRKLLLLASERLCAPSAYPAGLTAGLVP